MYGGVQAFCQSREVNRRLVPFAIVDALDIVEDVAAIQNGRRLTKGERLHFLRRAGGHVGLFWLLVVHASGARVCRYFNAVFADPASVTQGAWLMPG